MILNRLFVVSALALNVASCANQPPPDPPLWLRIDGQRLRDNPALQQQFEIDKTICLGQMQQSAVGMAPIYYQGLGGAISAGIIESQRNAALTDVAKGCMAQHGYIQVPASQAEARSEQLAANAKAQAASDKKPKAK